MNKSPREWILHVCNNANQCAVIIPVARELRDTHQIDSRFLSLDRYYNQSASDALAQYEFEFAELPGQHCDGRFYDALELRPAFAWEAAVEVHALFEEIAPSAILLGHDVEMVEQLIVREAERRGIPTARIQDGITGPIAPTKEPGLRAPHLVFEGSCDLMMTWNDSIRDNLNDRAVSGEIVTVGDPRSDALLTWQSEASQEPPYTVLLIGQVWAKHQNMTFDEEVAMYERIIRQFLSRPDTRILFRPHPVQVEQEVFQQFPKIFGDRVEVTSDGAIYDVLKTVNVVVSVSSTVTVEAAMLGIPTFRLLHLLESNPTVFERYEAKYLELLNSSEFPEVSYFERLSKEEFLAGLAPLFDGKAAHRSAECITRLLGAHRPANVEKVDVSVLLIQGAGDIAGAVHSILRRGEFAQEVLVCDVSANGSLREAVAEFSSDPRVRYFHRPGHSSGAALNEMIAEARAEVIARMSQGCIACPDWSKSLYEALQTDTEARIALSEYTIRDDLGLLWKTQVLPEQLTFEQLAAMETVTLTIQAYAFRKQYSVRLDERDPNAEGTLFTHLVADLNEPKRIAIVHGRRFFAPFDPDKLAVAGPPAMPRKPLFAVEPAVDEKLASPRLASETSCSVLLISPSLESLKHVQERLVPELQKEFSIDVVVVAGDSCAEYRAISHDIIRTSQGSYLGHLASANFAERCNEALLRARGEIALIAHPDAELTVESVRAHLSSHQESERSSFVMGGLELHPSLNCSLSGILFRSELLFGEAAQIHSGAIGVEQVRLMNFSMRREVFLENEFAFDSRFTGDWGRDFWFANELVEKEFNVYGFNEGATLYTRDWELLEFLRHEQSRAQDMIRIMNRKPEFARTFLSVPAITSSEMAKWESGVLEGLDDLPEIFEQVFDALRHIEREGQLAPDLESELATLIEHLVQVFCVREIVRHYSKSQEFGQVKINGSVI